MSLKIGWPFSASNSGKPIDLTQCDQKGCLLFRPPQDPMLCHDFSINKFILWGLPHSWTPSMSIYDKSMEIVGDLHPCTSQVYGNCLWYTSRYITSLWKLLVIYIHTHPCLSSSTMFYIQLYIPSQDEALAWIAVQHPGRQCGLSWVRKAKGLPQGRKPHETAIVFGGWKTGWWFGTFSVFPSIGNNHPNWLRFFRGVETTSQKTIAVSFFNSLALRGWSWTNHV